MFMFDVASICKVKNCCVNYCVSTSLRVAPYCKWGMFFQAAKWWDECLYPPQMCAVFSYQYVYTGRWWEERIVVSCHILQKNKLPDHTPWLGDKGDLRDTKTSHPSSEKMLGVRFSGMDLKWHLHKWAAFPRMGLRFPQISLLSFSFLYCIPCFSEWSADLQEQIWGNYRDLEKAGKIHFTHSLPLVIFWIQPVLPKSPDLKCLFLFLQELSVALQKWKKERWILLVQSHHTGWQIWLTQKMILTNC